MTIEGEIREAIEDAIDDNLPEPEPTSYLVPEHEHPGINERLSVLEARADGHDVAITTLTVHELEEEVMAAEEEVAPEPEPEPEPEPIEEDVIIDVETPEEEPEEEAPVEEDTPARRGFFDWFFGERKK